MKTWRPQLALMFGLAIICGCKPSAPNAKDAPSTTNATASKRITEEDLPKILAVGTPREEIIKRMGEPGSTTDFEDGTVSMIYVFRVRDQPGPRQPVRTGVSIDLKDGKVVRWSPILGSTGGHREGYQPEVIQPPKDANRQGNTTNTFTFWVVSEKPVDGGRYIDTPLFPKLGFVRNEPDLRVNRLKTLLQESELLLNDKGEEIENKFLNVHLVEEDAPALTKLTSANQGKRVLIMVDDRPVAALKILGSIGSAFQLHCKDAQTLKEAREKLAYLLSQ